MSRRLLSVLLAFILIMTLVPASSGSGGESDHPFAPSMPIVLSRPKVEERPWWETTSMDMDGNGVFDHLDSMLAKDPSGLFDIPVDMDREPSSKDLEAFSVLGLDVALVLEEIDCVGVRNAPGSLVPVIAQLAHVVMVEPRLDPVSYSDIATPTVKARQSTEYSPNTAWDLNYSGKGNTVCIMDTGIDDAHPSLAGKWVGGADFAKPNGIFNRHADDGSFNPDDTNGHGTTCAGIATGTGAPDGIYMGAAPDAKLVDLRIGTAAGFSPGEGPTGNLFDAALEATEWAISHAHHEWTGQDPEYYGIDILSLSWGIPWEGSSDGSDAYSRLLDQLVAQGTVVSVAAGNDGPDNEGITGMSAASDGIIVGSLDDKDTIDRSDDSIADYSSRGPRDDNGDGYPFDEMKPDISSPGTGITQAEFSRTGDGAGNGYGERGSGTSYAAPNVAGVSALILEANSNLTPAIVREVIRAGAERTGDPTYPDLDPFWNRDYGWGMIDAYRSVRMAEFVEDPGMVDVELQCFVMNHSLASDETGAGLAGIAWSRAGQVDVVEYRLDGGEWVQVESLGNDTFSQWTAQVPLTGLSPGNHTIEVRSVGGEKESVHDFIEFGLEAPPAGEVKEERDLTGLFLLLGILLVGGAALVAYKTGKLKVPSRGRAKTPDTSASPTVQSKPDVKPEAAES